jgi:hypothetical protein
LITGQPGRDDKGRNEILLSGRIYAKGFEIPFASGNVKNDFLKLCFASIQKEGYETRRLGGSAGNEGATVEQLQYFQKHRGCCPNIAGAVFHHRNNNGTWRAYYITPYQRSKKKMVATWVYSTPKQGGHVDWAKSLAETYPLFFSNMSKVRSTMSTILLSLNSKCLISISPVAANVQALYNMEARESLYNARVNSDQDFTTTMLLDILNKQVVYSMVPYTVGNHKDVTQNNCASELIECKACIQWPEKSVLMGANLTMPALGRGGAGPGIYTVMVVDHPKKKN